MCKSYWVLWLMTKSYKIRSSKNWQYLYTCVRKENLRGSPKLFHHLLAVASFRQGERKTIRWKSCWVVTCPVMWMWWSIIFRSRRRWPVAACFWKNRLLFKWTMNIADWNCSQDAPKYQMSPTKKEDKCVIWIYIFESFSYVVVFGSF